MEAGGAQPWANAKTERGRSMAVPLALLVAEIAFALLAIAVVLLNVYGKPKTKRRLANASDRREEFSVGAPMGVRPRGRRAIGRDSAPTKS